MKVFTKSRAAALATAVAVSLVATAPAAEAASLPPGIVLSLVENALEHGIAPTLERRYGLNPAMGAVR